LRAIGQENVAGAKMSDTETADNLTTSGEGRERGARRRKIYGYLKAANEIRHSYTTQLTQDGSADDQSMPGMFPDVEVFRSGNEEMVLFPSYARKHLRPNPTVHHEKPGAIEDIDRPQITGDVDYWKREWQRFEDENAIVDIDVRGWIYSPSRTPLNRKNRLLVAVARRLSGIPAPSVSPNHSRAPSRHSTHRENMEERTTKREEEIAAKEAQFLVQRGESEADAAWQGDYSQGLDFNSNGPSPLNSRSNSPVRTQRSHGGDRPTSLSEFSLGSDDDDPVKHSIAKARYLGQPSPMSKEEIVVAHQHLIDRLRPFMTMPLASAPITIFFFNDKKSQSKTVDTNDSGHFNVRASLDFLPTHIRVLASENVSATEPVHITEAKGISLISDIDDTIKHSAIASGAKEIFKNTFIRDLQDLTIQGVKEWYTKLYSMGVKLHYVSNSPWQLYPLLRSYFALAGLPPGSIHLKQYSGMLQGIFEPAAERKRGSLDRIMSDFPERRFVLVGDSGEADLEVYTDVVMANPGRVLAVYIRDVTTPEKKKFFDQAVSNVGPDSKARSNGSHDHYSHSPPSHDQEKRPSLPERRNALSESGPESIQTQENLIDFEDEPEDFSKETSYLADLLELHGGDRSGPKRSPPPRPVKPAELCRPSSESRQPKNHDRIASTNSPAASSPLVAETPKSPPPKPRRPSNAVQLPNVQTNSPSQRAPFSSARQQQDSTIAARPDLGNRSSSSKTTTKSSMRPDLGDRSSSSKTITKSSVRPDLGPRHQTSASTKSDYSTRDEEGYAASARRQLTSVYNALPSIRSSSPSRDNGLLFKPRNPSDPSPRVSEVPPPFPPRRGLTSYPVAAARWAAGAATGASGGDPAAGGGGGAPAGAPYNKKEEMWRRRWARAKDIMKREGVILRSWRVGTDVMDGCVAIVEGNFRELKHEGGGMGGKHKAGERPRESRLRRG
jgi:phosphatidate phosphatase APP1